MTYVRKGVTIRRYNMGGPTQRNRLPRLEIVFRWCTLSHLSSSRSSPINCLLFVSHLLRYIGSDACMYLVDGLGEIIPRPCHLGLCDRAAPNRQRSTFNGRQVPAEAVGVRCKSLPRQQFSYLRLYPRIFEVSRYRNEFRLCHAGRDAGPVLLKRAAIPAESFEVGN